MLAHVLYSANNRLVYRSYISNHFVNLPRLHFLCGLHFDCIFDYISCADYDYGFEKNKVLLDPTQVVAVIFQSSSGFRFPSTERVKALFRRKRVPPLSLVFPRRVSRGPVDAVFTFQVPRLFRVENLTVTQLFIDRTSIDINQESSSLA